MDREKVVRDLRYLKSFGRVSNNPQITEIAENALELLKEQEAVTIKKTKEHGFGVYGGICPKCQNWIQSPHSFCGFCGQAVKWE